MAHMALRSVPHWPSRPVMMPSATLNHHHTLLRPFQPRLQPFYSLKLVKYSTLRPSHRHRFLVSAHSDSHNHQGHDHSHNHHKHDHKHNECSSGSHSACCDVTGHHHGGTPIPTNPIHKVLKYTFDVTRITHLADWLEDSMFSTVSKVVLFVVAGITAWLAGRVVDVAASFNQISTLATAGVFFFAGIPAAVELLYDITALRIDTHVLMNLAVVGTLVTGHPLEGALLLVLFQTSHAVEHLLTAQAQGNLQALYDAVPNTAVVVEVDKEGAPVMSSWKRVPAADVSVGQVMLVKPGEQAPLDGIIVHGRALVSAEHITGESLPTLKNKGDQIPAGALCHDGILGVQALETSENSTPARIARLARDAQTQRPELRTWLDTFGEYYSKLVIVGAVGALAVMVAAGVPLLSTGAVERGALYRAMGLLTVASPCALVMVPLAYVSAIAATASRGILLKGGRVLDAIDGCRVVGVDKTGTLTTGKLAVVTVEALQADNGTANTEEALAIAAALSMRSTHPVSDAVVEYSSRYGRLDAKAAQVEDFNLVAGGGVGALVTLSSSREMKSTRHGTNSNNSRSTYQVSFGSFEFVQGNSLTSDEVTTIKQRLDQRGLNGTTTTSILVINKNDSATLTTDDRSIWIFSFEDSVRSMSAAAVESLQQGTWAGTPKSSRVCDVVMLTGDNEASAARVAGLLGISKVFAGLSPEEKLQHVLALRKKRAGSEKTANTSSDEARNNGSQADIRKGVMMVGDGLNDAAALAAADVGIAFASSSTAAATLASDAVVMNETAGMSAIPLLLRIARATRYVIRQNLALAAGSILILVAPTVLGFIPLWLAVIMHEGTTLLVALNSLRLLRFSSHWVKSSSGGLFGVAVGTQGHIQQHSGIGVSEDSEARVAFETLPTAA